MNPTNKTIDILCVGEALIDFIGTQLEVPIAETKDYHRYLGGSPTNVAMNMSRLGASVDLVATIGNDGFGSYIENRLKETNIGVEHLAKIDTHASTVIFVNRSTETPEFIPMRGADSQIFPAQLPSNLLERTKIYHTTCFALSLEPARSTILETAKLAIEKGCELSIDINYSEKIWPDTQKALETIKMYCSLGSLVKVSQDDMDRLFGPGMSHDDIFKTLHQFGAKLVCLTLGKEGSKLSEQGAPVIKIAALKLDRIVDATGAGDAFWSGFLFAYLNKKTSLECMEVGMQMAAIKLQNVGRIPDYIPIISKFLKK